MHKPIIWYDMVIGMGIIPTPMPGPGTTGAKGGGLNEKNIEVDKYFLGSSNISTCTGCEHCIKTGTCSIQDDVTEIIEKGRRIYIRFSII